MKIIKMLRRLFRFDSNLTKENVEFATKTMARYDLSLVQEDHVRRDIYDIMEDSLGSTEMKIRVQKYMDKHYKEKWQPKENLYLQYEDYENLIERSKNTHIDFSLTQVLLAADSRDGYIATCENINYYIS